MWQVVKGDVNWKCHMDNINDGTHIPELTRSHAKMSLAIFKYLKGRIKRTRNCLPLNRATLCKTLKKHGLINTVTHQRTSYILLPLSKKIHSARSHDEELEI